MPAKYKGRPFNIFETGGTTGMPKQRIGWDDYKVDYSEFSEKISDEHFPRNHYWLMMGPTGPRRLRLAIEHLANVRGSSCYFIDLDPRWVKKLIANKQFDQARAYMDHVVDQAVTILKHRKVSGLFTTPKLLEALAEKINLCDAGIRGVFCGGTTMAPQYVRFIVEEVLENRIGFYPTYGNTLMGLAASVPLRPEDNFSITYYAPQPRAVLRVVDPKQTDRPGGLRPMGPRRAHHADEGVLHAPLPRARRSPAPPPARALRLGRRRRGASLRRDGENNCGRCLLTMHMDRPHLPALRLGRALREPRKNRRARSSQRRAGGRGQPRQCRHHPARSRPARGLARGPEEVHVRAIDRDVQAGGRSLR